MTAREEFEKTLKTFVAINADGVEVWRTRCHTQEQAARKWKVACPEHHYVCRIKEKKGK